MASFNLIMFQFSNVSLKIWPPEPTPHFRHVPISTDYSKPPTCSAMGTRLQYKMHLLKDGSPHPFHNNLPFADPLSPHACQIVSYLQGLSVESVAAWCNLSPTLNAGFADGGHQTSFVSACQHLLLLTVSLFLCPYSLYTKGELDSTTGFWQQNSQSRLIQSHSNLLPSSLAWGWAW